MGIMQMLLGGARIVTNLNGTVTAISGGTSKPANAKANYNSDGTITDGGTAVSGSHSYSGPANWYAPTTVGIGSSNYIRWTIISDPDGTISASPTAGTIGVLTSGSNITCGAAAAQITGGQAKVETFADSGGTVLTGTGTITLDAEGS